MKAERWIATQAVALGKNCDGVRTGLDNNLCFEGIGAICVANRRKGALPPSMGGAPCAYYRSHARA